MSAPGVDVWDPSPEGRRVLEHLRQEGFGARSIALAEVPVTRASVLVMAGDVEGALGVLKLLRDEGPRGDLPVVLLGVPDALAHHGGGPAFGADAVLARPVALEPLVRAVRQLLDEAPARSGGAVPERARQVAGEPGEPPSSQVVALRADEPWRPREPTLQLRDGPIPGSSVHPRGPSKSSVLPRTSSGVTRAPTGTGSRPGTPASVDVPEPTIPPEERALLSPWLEELLRAADRRVFPDRPSLVLHFPAAKQPPEVLVPAELLELAPFRIDEPAVDDPIDAFTYAGGPAIPSGVPQSSVEEHGGEAPRERKTSPESPARGLRGPRAKPEVTTGVEVPLPRARRPAEPAGAELPEEETLLGRPAPDGSRRGALGAGGALRLLWRIAARGVDGTLTIACEAGLSVRMTFLAGELRAFGGPVAQIALETLRRRGRAVEVPADEAGADAVLKRRVELGELGRFERDRLLREAQESLLERVIRATEATCHLRRLEDTEPGRLLHGARVLGRPLRAALVDAARTALPTETVLELIGSEPVGVALGPEREAGLAPAELPFELCELLVRMEGRTLTEILAAAPTEPGLAGALYALVAGDVLVLTEAPSDARMPDEVRASVRSLVEAAAALALEGDYFAILGVPRDAAAREVDRAYRGRRDELGALPLALLGLSALEQPRREALEALDEALRALSDGARRAAYAAALAT